MATSRFPAYLRLIGPFAQEARTAREESAEPLSAHEIDPQTGLATRQALLDRLETMGLLAPGAPLSFLVIKVAGLGHRDQDGQLRAIATRLLELIRATDVAGRLSGTAFGIALQGTGVTAAGAVAARLTHHLNRLPDLAPSICITVSAATGTGRHAETLPIAAMDTFEPCCG